MYGVLKTNLHLLLVVRWDHILFFVDNFNLGIVFFSIFWECVWVLVIYLCFMRKFCFLVLLMTRANH